MENNRFVDEMTPKERIKALVEGKPYDRIPCSLNVGAHAARVTGIKVSEYNLSAKKLAEAQIAAYKTYGTESIGVHPSIVEAIGCKVVYPEQSTPYVADHIVNDFSVLDNLELIDPLKAGPLQVFWEGLKILDDELGTEVPISVGINGPFSLSANLRGIDKFLRDLYYHPEFAHRLLRFALDNTILVVKEAGKLGVSFGIFDPTASGSLISPKQYREFAFPYQKELIKTIKQAGGGAAMLHMCGNTKKIWQDMVDTGAGSLSLDNIIDLAEAKQAVGDQVIITGNVRPAETMYLGKPEDVVENVKECLGKAYDSPKGYVLTLGCGLPIDTPPENIHALVGAVRKYGRYPLKPEQFS